MRTRTYARLMSELLPYCASRRVPAQPGVLAYAPPKPYGNSPVTR